jgi:hypothetical protein
VATGAVTERQSEEAEFRAHDGVLGAFVFSGSFRIPLLLSYEHIELTYNELSLNMPTEVYTSQLFLLPLLLGSMANHR